MVAIPSGEVCVLLGELCHLHVNPSQGWRQNYLLLGGSQAPLVRETQTVRRKEQDLHSKDESSLGYKNCFAKSSLCLLLNLYLKKYNFESFMHNS